MAAQLYNHFADLQALQGEKTEVLNIFGQIKKGIVDLQTLGFKIDSSKTIAEASKAGAALEKVQQQLIQQQAKLDDAVLKTQRLQAQAGEAEAKRLLAEAKLREANAKAANAEAAAMDRKQKAQEQQANTPAKQGISNANEDLTINDTDAYNRKLLVDMNERLRVQQELLDLEMQEQKLRQMPANGERLYTDEEINATNAQNAAYAEKLDNIKKQTIANSELTVKVNELNAAISALDGEEQLQAKNLLASIEKQIVAENELTANRKLQKQLQAQMQGGGTAVQQEQLQKLRLEENVLNAEAKELNFTVAQQTKLFNAEAGSIQKLQAEYELMAQQYRLMSAEQKASPIGTALKADIEKAVPVLKAAEAEIGKSQRNVGNYGSALTGFFSKAFTGLRQLAYLIPGIGMAGIINLIVDGLVAAWDKLDFSLTKTSEAQKRQTSLMEASYTAGVKTAESYGQQKAQLDVLVGSLNNSNIKHSEKMDIITKLQKLYPGYFDNIKTEKDLVDKLPAAYAKASEGILLMAQAKAAQDVIGENYTRKFKAEAEYLKNVSTTIADFQKQRSEFTGIGGAVGENKLLEETQSKIKAFSDTYKDVVQDVDTQNKFLLKSVIDANVKIEGLGGKITKPTKTKATTFDDSERKDAEDLFKQRMQYLIEYEKAFANLEGSAVKNRLDSRKREADYEKQLIKGVAEFDLKAHGINETERTRIREQEAADLKAVDTKLAVDSIKIRVEAENKVDEEADKLMEERHKIELQNIETERQKRIDALTNDLEGKQQANVNNQDAELIGLNKQYQNGLLAKEEYEAKKQNIQNKYQAQDLQDSLQYYIQLTLIAGLPADKQAEALKQLNAIQHKLRQQDLKDFETVEDLKIAATKKRNAALKELGLQLADTLKTILEGGVDAQKNNIQKQLDNIDILKEAEITRINQTTLSEQDKAARIAIINNKAQNDKEALDRRNRELDRKKAVFERAYSAFKITEAEFETIAKLKLANAELSAQLIKATGSGNPLAITLATAAKIAGEALVPISIAMSAAQLAAVLGTPLPGYWQGTGYAQEGFAHVAEKGQELAVDQTGKLTLYQHPTIAYLKEGTKVFPNNVTEDILRANTNAAQTASATKQQTIVINDDSKVVEQLKELNKKDNKIVIINKAPIETTAWYFKAMKN